MPFTPVAAPQIDLLQNAVDGDVYIPSFSRRSFLQGATAGLLSLAPALTMVGNLLTVNAPVRNYSLATFAGLGLSIETTVVAGNFPVVANRDVQVKNVASTGHTYTYPTSRRVGQLLVMAVATAALTTITTPSGWTLVQSQAGTESRTSIFTRVIDGLEPSTELLAFGTASGAVVRTWMIDIGDAPVEAVAGINDSAAGTSLDLATISPTWAVAEATSTLYIAVLGLADDVTVSGFPAGYTVTGQDKSVSGTANVDCALAYAERSALGSSENPGAFTYAASRSTGHVLAIKPKVTARLNWDGLTVRKNSGADVGTRRRVNLIEGSGVTLTVADDGTEIDVTIAASGGSAHVFRDDGVDMTQRAAANFITSTTITAILTDDAVNNETEITFQLGAHTGDVTSAANSLALTIANNAVTNAKAADMAALTVKANPTNATADPQDVASAADDTVFRRTATTLNWGQLTVGMAPNDVWTYAKIQNVSATARILGRITAGAGDIEELTGTQATTLLDNFTSALKGLAPASGGGTTNFLRADGTWAAPPGTLTAGHVIRDDGVGMTQRAALNFVSGATAGNITFVLADDAGNNETEVTGTLAAQAANTLLANATNASAVPTALAIAAESVVGRTSGDLQAITSSVQSILMRAAGSVFWGTAAADQVLRRSGSGDLGFGTLVTNNIGNSQITYAKIQNVVSDDVFLGRISGAGGIIEELTGTQATSLLNVFTSALKGLAPASGGGTVNFLRADGTWTTPPFVGIRINDGTQTARSNINFFQSTTIDPAGIDDSVNNELEIRFNILINSVGNTLLTDMAQARLKGRAMGAGTGDPTDLTGTQAASMMRWNTVESFAAPGLAATINVAEDTTVLRFSNGGLTGIVTSIGAPTTEGQVLFLEATAGGGDETIFVQDSTVTAGTIVRTPGGIPYRQQLGAPLGIMHYSPTANAWDVIGEIGGDHGAILEINEHFDNANGPTALEAPGNTLFVFSSSNHSWCANATPNAGSSGSVGNVDNELHHRGIMRVTSSNALNDGTAIYIARDVMTGGGIVETESMYDSDQIWRFEVWVRVPTATTFRVTAGFMQDPTNTDGGTEFIGFVGATSSVTSTTNWVAVCRAASTNTALDTAVAFSTLWHKLEFFRFDEYVFFYVNRNYIGCISTNVPNGNGTIGVRVQTLTAASRSVDVDRIILHLREAAYD